MLLQRTCESLLYLLAFIALWHYATAATAAPPIEDSTVRSAGKRAADCETGLSWMCLKIEFVKLMERLAEQPELQLLPGLSVVRDANATEPQAADMMAEVARSFPHDAGSRLNAYIVRKLESLLRSRYLRLKLIDAASVAEARSLIETGRKGKFGKKGGLEALLAAGLMMKGTLMALGMGALALLAGKALITALLALTLSGVVGLKSLAGGGKTTTYEIVAKPIYTSSHTHSLSHEDAHGGGGGGGGLGHSGGGGLGHSGSGYGGYGRRALNLDVANHLGAASSGSK